MLSRYFHTLNDQGAEYTTLICQSNRRRLMLNQWIRRYQGKSAQPEAGDVLMITQNNLLLPFQNGDQIVICHLGATIRKAGFRFQEGEFRFLHSPTLSYKGLMMVDLLHLPQINLTIEDQRRLIMDFSYRMQEEGIERNSEKFHDRMKTDPYLNALRVVYGYAITCHKSQGGEWPEVFLDMNGQLGRFPQPYLYQRWYTAITRASQHVHLADQWYIS